MTIEHYHKDEAGLLRPTELSPAYIAGILDGEGCFSIAINRNRQRGCIPYGPFIAVDMASSIPYLLHERYGGMFKPRPLRTNKQAFVWRVYGQKLLVVLDEVDPFLIEKRDRAILLRELQNTKVYSGRGKTFQIPQEVLARRDEIYATVRNLNA